MPNSGSGFGFRPTAKKSPMMRSGEIQGTEDAAREAVQGECRTHLVTVDPVKGRRAWERAWCSCGAEGEFPVDGHAEEWALTHPSRPTALGGWRVAEAS